MPSRTCVAPAHPLQPSEGAFATWSIEIRVGGERVAEVVARRPLTPLDFDPSRLVRIVQNLLGKPPEPVRNNERVVA